MEKITLPVELDGLTREVSFSKCREGLYVSGPVFAAKIGMGAKTHTANMCVTVQPDKETASKRGYSARRGTLVEKDGVLYGLDRSCVVLNKQATIYGFIEKTEITSQHNNENRY